jgi:hypothetical protein
MKPTHLILLLLILPLAGQVTTLLTETATDWAYLHPTDGTDPAVSGSDPDFQATWFEQALGTYAGGSFHEKAVNTGLRFTSSFVHGVGRVTRLPPVVELTTARRGLGRVAPMHCVGNIGCRLPSALFATTH